ncbi:BF3164 family lipoprotein [Belliella aquatica]|nr:BF3164 family lipoprotein [Belliella aquatica]MCH7405509.1 TolB-like 6-bladed beta-propeller domain-containing protein [Belliella aquatica]
MNKIKYGSILLLILFIRCNTRSELDRTRFMVLDSFVYATEFPSEFILDNKMETGLDIVGAWDFAIQDSLMIFSTRNNNGLWKFLSLPELNELGDFLIKGEGPLEFSSYPSVTDKVNFSEIGGVLFSYIYDFDNGRLLKLNINKSLKNKETIISVIDDSLPKFLFDFMMLDSGRYFYREISNMETQQLRSLDHFGNVSVNINMAKLNEASVMKGIDFTVMTTMTRYNEIHDKIVEMNFGLNYINLYAVDGDFGKTICVESKLDDIGQIESKENVDRIFRFSDVRVYDNFFGLVYVNEKEETYFTSRKNLPEILLFDWEGNPLAKLKLQSHISTFDIDFLNNEIYTFDSRTDEFAKYDIGEILSVIQK